jgi:hypothetical protein
MNSIVILILIFAVAGAALIVAGVALQLGLAAALICAGLFALGAALSLRQGLILTDGTRRG